MGMKSASGDGGKQSMKGHALLCAAVLLMLMPQTNTQQPFTLEQVMSAPFPANFTAAKQNNRVAWTLNQQGRRNVWVAEGPGFTARQITKYSEDDGQELSEVSFSMDSNTIVYVRGDGQIWIALLDGTEKAQQLVVRGQNSDPHWSPDGSRLAFVSARNDHAFIGVYDVRTKTLHFLAPSVDSDGDLAWSLDGRRIAFVRRPAEARDTPQGYSIAPDKPHPWAIWVAEAAAGTAREIWHSGATPQGSFPYMAEDTGGAVINWAANNQLLIASEED